MALNSILSYNNKIKEIEENEPNSPPSISTLERKKTIPDLYSSHFQKNIIPISKRKSKSYSYLLNSQNLQILFFSENTLKNNLNNKKKSINNDIEFTNINIDRERNLDNNTFYENSNTNNINMNKSNNINDDKNENYFKTFKKYIPESARVGNNNIIKNINKNAKNSVYINSSNSEESEDKKNINVNRRFKNKRIFKKKLNKSNSTFNSNILNNGKKALINKIDLYKQNINIYDNNNNTKIIKENESHRVIKPKKNENLLTNTNSFFYKKNTYNNINKPYVKKKIECSRNFESISKKESITSSLNNSLKRYSLQSNTLQKNKKRPLILNVNLQKKKLPPSLKISQFQRILKSNRILNILRFFDYYDIINIFKTKNKKMIILINTALAYAYYPNIRNYLLKYNDILELLKCTIVKTQIKDSLKIDLVINIRFLNSKYHNILSKYKKENISFIEPLYFQFTYLYNYFPKIKPKKELITKEEYENQNKSKKLKMYDNYTFDLYPGDYLINNYINNFHIFISKELPIKERDNNNLGYVQPILPFLENDKAIINLELYSTDNGFIDPKSIKIVIKSYNLKNYINKLNDKEISNMRISEYEELCVHWKNINLYEMNIKIIDDVQMLFSPFFQINNICFENIGVYIFKVSLTAVKSGEINEKKKIGIKIKIKEKNEYIENEIRKNNLIFERRDIFELRVGDELLYYFCSK